MYVHLFTQTCVYGYTYVHRYRLLSTDVYTLVCAKGAEAQRRTLFSLITTLPKAIVLGREGQGGVV